MYMTLVALRSQAAGSISRKRLNGLAEIVFTSPSVHTQQPGVSRPCSIYTSRTALTLPLLVVLQRPERNVAQNLADEHRDGLDAAHDPPNHRVVSTSTRQRLENGSTARQKALRWPTRLRSRRNTSSSLQWVRELHAVVVSVVRLFVVRGVGCCKDRHSTHGDGSRRAAAPRTPRGAAATLLTDGVDGARHEHAQREKPVARGFHSAACGLSRRC
jgi:hypothetical protein